MVSRYVVGTILALLTSVDAAKTSSSNGSGTISISGSGGDSTFDAPPLAVANLVVYALLLFPTVVQLAIAARALFRDGFRIPAAGVAVALTLLVIAYILNLAFVVVSYTYDNRGPRKSIKKLHLDVASTVFLDLKDLATFTAVALVLRHCYLSGKPLRSALMAFSSVAAALFVGMVVFLAAQMGIFEATTRARQRLDITFTKARARFDIANDLLYVFIVFQVLTVLFLAVSAFLVKPRTKNDTITTMTLFGIIPLLVLFAMARIIFVILSTRLPLSGFYTPDVGLELELASTIVYGLLYLGIMSILVFLLSFPRYWSAQPASDALSAQGAPSSHAFVPGMPPAQFPGQWGYPQQPQQQQMVSSQPPQHYAYVPVYPDAVNRQPLAEKVETSLLPTPPVSS